MLEDQAAECRQFEPIAFGPLIGQKANGCWVGYGSALFLEFGERACADDLHHPSGEWSLWCNAILWRIEQGDRVLAGSEDDRDTMDAAVNQLNGNALISGGICRYTGDSVLTFTDNLVLRTFVLTSEEDARWNLRRGDSEPVMLGPAIKASPACIPPPLEHREDEG
jgi:hypothetical protein